MFPHLLIEISFQKNSEMSHFVVAKNPDVRGRWYPKNDFYNPSNM